MTLQNIQSNEVMMLKKWFWYEILTIDVVLIEQWKRSISVEQNKYPISAKRQKKTMVARACILGNQVIDQWFINGNLKDEIYWNMLWKMLFFKAVKSQGPDSP